MYQGIFFGVVAVLCALLWVGRETSDSKVDTKGAALRWRYLTVFLVFKLGDWMQGPYFHEMYSTKVGQAEVAMLFLMAFVSATIGSLAVGKALDTYGGKAGSIAFAVLFSASGLTALSNDYNVLMLGRILGGVAASLLNTSPETWLISEIQHQSLPSSFTDYIFSWMYFSDGIVAVIAGWVADGAVSQTSDVTSPFITSSVITVIGGVLCFFLWPTNKKGTNTSTAKSPKLHLGSMAALVVTQAFFESAMYVFVLNWGKAVSSADSGSVPYGTIFSAFMTSTMIGTTVASFLMKKSFQAAQLLTFSAAIGFSGLVLALYSLDNPYALVVSFCMYEAAVGVYFPSIGCLRAQLIPEASRGMLMNMCRVPLNLMVITAMLYYEALGVEGGLKLCITALVLMCIATLYLHSNTVKSKSE